MEIIKAVIIGIIPTSVLIRGVLFGAVFLGAGSQEPCKANGQTVKART